MAINTTQNGVVTAVTSSATAVTLLGANRQRNALIIQNSSTAILYLLFSAQGTVSTSNYSVVIAATASSIPGSYIDTTGYQGVIQAIWASANGTAYCTELT